MFSRIAIKQLLQALFVRCTDGIFARFPRVLFLLITKICVSDTENAGEWFRISDKKRDFVCPLVRLAPSKQPKPRETRRHHTSLLQPVLLPSTMASSSSKEAADATLRAPMLSIDWLQRIELGYDGVASSNETPVCFRCGKDDAKLSHCAKCSVAGYCSRDCQVQDWKTGTGGGHKHSCQGEECSRYNHE